MSMQNEWTANASADNATATATKAASTSQRHVITTVIASYGGAKTGLLTIKEGSTTLLEHYVVNSEVITFPNGGLRASTTNLAVSAELAASGTGGTLGKVALVGYSV